MLPFELRVVPGDYSDEKNLQIESIEGLKFFDDGSPNVISFRLKFKTPKFVSKFNYPDKLSFEVTKKEFFAARKERAAVDDSKLIFKELP